MIRGSATLATFLGLAAAVAAPAPEGPTLQIDLPTALRLAGAQNFDVQIARERLGEAQANETSAAWRFFPWLAVGVGVRRHDWKIEDVRGDIISTHKFTYAPGVTIGASLDLGDAWYQKLAAHQRVRASELQLEGERQRVILDAAERYLGLAVAQATVGVADEALALSRAYEAEVHQAVLAGVALRAEELKVNAEVLRNSLAARKTRAARRVAAARLAETLRMDPTADLSAQDTDVVPISIIAEGSTLETLLGQARQAHPRIRQSEAAIEAAHAESKGTTYGPLVPTVTGQAFVGGVGGGRDDGPKTFGGATDVTAMVQWRIGPGGIGDKGRVEAAHAREAATRQRAEQVRQEATRQVVDAYTQWRSTAEQLEIARLGLTAAEEARRLARERQQFAVANVLENIVADQDLTRARHDYLRAVGEHDVAQYTLHWAIGGFQGQK